MPNSPVNPYQTPDSYLPSLWDRADGGRTNPLGTATPFDANGTSAVAINYIGTTNNLNDGGTNPQGFPYIFEEASDSPTTEFGEQCTITHKYYVDYYSGQLLQATYPRGLPMIDAAGNITRVLSTTLVPIPKSDTGVCILTVISEAQSFATPPDEFTIETVELNPALEKHPRYAALTYQDKYLIRGQTLSDNIDVQETYGAQLALLSGSLTSDLTDLTNEAAQAQELLLKRQKGEESFYLSGYKITYSRYYWGPVPLNPGGYIEDPFETSNVPPVFVTDPDGNNIFAYTSVWNTNLYPNVENPDTPQEAPYGLSWLRQTDSSALVRTWTKVTSTWIGGPLAQWDNELYNPEFQPYQTQRNQGNNL